MILTTAEAEELMRVCVTAARQPHDTVAIAVVDVHGNVLCARRPTSVRLLTVKLAIARAFTAAVMKRSTRMLTNWQEQKPMLFLQLSKVHAYPLIAGDGGVPIARDGVLLGALGIATPSGDGDQDIAEAGLSALGFQVEFGEN